MRYHDNRWGAWLGMAALAIILLIALAPLFVGCRSGQPEHGSEMTVTADARTATPRPPMVGGGATANPSEVTPTPTVTPVESVSGAASDLATAQPAVTTTQALKAQLDEQPVSTGEGAGSSPAQGSMLTPPLATQGASKADGDSLYQLLGISPWPAYLWADVACIVMRESGGIPSKVGAAGERGLMQVHPIHIAWLAEQGYSWDSMFDPSSNLAAGYALYLEAGGFSPWRGGCR